MYIYYTVIIDLFLPHVNSIFRVVTARVKVKVKVKFTLGQATKPQKGSSGIALFFP